MKKIRFKRKVLKERAAEVNLPVKLISEEVLPLLLGMELLWNESPQQYLFKFDPETRNKIIKSLNITGYIVGNESNWTFSSGLYERVFKSLLNNPRCKSMAENATQKAPVRLVDVVVLYKKLLKKVPGKLRLNYTEKPAPALRRLVIDYGAEQVLEALPEFFKQSQTITSLDYRVEKLKEFLTKPMAQKPEWAKW